MGKRDIIELLKRNYPEYLSYKDIIQQLELSRRTILRNLQGLKNYNEIEYIMVLNKKNRFIKKYRIKIYKR